MDPNTTRQARYVPPAPTVDATRLGSTVRLDLHDDDERMTNDLPMIHTSTERTTRLEQAVIRLTARVKALEAALEAMQGGK